MAVYGRDDRSRGKTERQMREGVQQKDTDAAVL